MPTAKTFNPKGVLVARRVEGIKLGGRHYPQGKPIGLLGYRKALQLYTLGHVCHPNELEADGGSVLPSDEVVVEAAPEQVETPAEPEVVESNEEEATEEESSESAQEEAPAPAPKKKRRKK